jgi:predicted kinase
MNDNRIIYLLIGPKGSGKSFIGSLFQEYFGITFVRVEDWAKTIKRDRNVDNDEYIKEVFSAIGKGIFEIMETHDSIVFESTGLSEHFENMLADLSLKFRVIQIQVKADLDLCLRRVKTRDQAIHINVSDEQVHAINTAVAQKQRDIKLIIENTHKTKEQLIDEIRNLMKVSKHL